MGARCRRTLWAERKHLREENHLYLPTSMGLLIPLEIQKTGSLDFSPRRTRGRVWGFHSLGTWERSGLPELGKRSGVPVSLNLKALF